MIGKGRLRRVRECIRRCLGDVQKITTGPILFHFKKVAESRSPLVKSLGKLNEQIEIYHSKLLRELFRTHFPVLISVSLNNLANKLS